MQRISIEVAALALCAVAGLAHDTDTDTDKSPPVGYDVEKHQQLIEDAHRGDAEAQYGVAILIPTIADDHGAGFIEAIAWHRKSADQGFAHAQTTLGLAYATATASRSTTPKPPAGADWPPNRGTATGSSASA